MKMKCSEADNSCREEKMGCTGCAYDKKIGTTIYTKYKIGQRVWVVETNKEHKEVEVYSDIIDGIFLDSKGDIYYFLEQLCSDVIESKLIPYEYTNALLKEIIKADNEVNKE